MIIHIAKRLGNRAIICALACCLMVGTGWAADGAALFEAGRFDEARRAFLDVLERRPDDPEALYYLGRLSSQGVHARRFFERLLEKHPSHALADDALFELAEADYADPAERYLSARHRYKQLLDRYPTSPHAQAARYRIGLTYLVVQAPDSALVMFERVDPLSDWAPHARLGALEAQVMLGRQSEALRSAENWLRAGAGEVQADVAALVARLRPAQAANAVSGQVFWVQVGAFGNAGNVAALKERLERAGFSISVVHREGDALLRVFAGPYRDRDAAERDRQRISQLEKLPCVVTDRQ